MSTETELFSEEFALVRAEDLNQCYLGFTNRLNDFYSKLGIEEGIQNYTLNIPDGAFEIIARYYFQFVYGELKPIVQENIDSYKIAGALELIIVLHQPIDLTSKSDIPSGDDELNRLTRQVNGAFAYYTAYVLAVGMDRLKYNESMGELLKTPQIQDLFRKFLEQHLLRLSNMDIDSLENQPNAEIPVIANAEVWQLMHALFQINDQAEFPFKVQ